MIGRVLALALLVAGSAQAQAPAEQIAFDLGTPRRALHLYLSACRAGDYATASRVLDLSRISPRDRSVRGEALAEHFKRVLDRTLWLDLESISDARDGDLGDGLPSDQERVGSIAASGGSIEVRLARIEGAWKLPDSIVARIPALYQEFGDGLLGEWLPAPFFEWVWLEIHLWQWIGLIVLALLSAAVSWPCARLLLAGARPIVSRIAPQSVDRPVRSALGAVRLGLAGVIFTSALPLLALSVPVQAFFLGTARVLIVFAAARFAFGVIDLALAALGERMLARERHSAVAILPAVGRVSKSALGVLAFLLTMQGLGFNVTAALAGLGVGGIAVALAAQRTLENLFGGLTLIADQPVRVGDFCRFGEKLGTVEDIGLRSTRVRTLDRTVVTIPNADFSRMQLENYATRDRIWYNPRLGLRYETSPEQIRYLLVEIRRLLYAHPRVSPDGARVRFVGFGESSLDLDVFAYVNASDYADFLEVAEDLNLHIMEIVGAAGSGFAFPSQTVYVEQGEGLDRERASSAEAEVARWRDARQLYLPGFPQSEIERMRHSLEYPSSDSPQAAGSTRRISV